MKVSFLNIKTRSLLKRNKVNRTTTPYKGAVSIGILFSVEDKSKHEAIKEFIKAQETEGKQISVITYLPDKKENFEFLFNFFSDRDISFWGSLRSYDAIVFSETPFDYLYCFDTLPNPFILHLLARSKAKCRIGMFWKDGESYFEMMINNVLNTRGLIDEALRYTKSIR